MPVMGVHKKFAYGEGGVCSIQFFGGDFWNCFNFAKPPCGEARVPRGGLTSEKTHNALGTLADSPFIKWSVMWRKLYPVGDWVHLSIFQSCLHSKGCSSLPYLPLPHILQTNGIFTVAMATLLRKTKKVLHIYMPQSNHTNEILNKIYNI